METAILSAVTSVLTVLTCLILLTFVAYLKPPRDTDTPGAAGSATTPTGPERVEHAIELLAAAAVQRYPKMDPDSALERHLIDHLHIGYYRADLPATAASDTAVSPTSDESAAKSG